MPTSIRLAADTENRLAWLASRTGRSKAFYVRAMIEDGLAEWEDYLLAAPVIERLSKGTEPTYPLSEVARELGLDD